MSIRDLGEGRAEDAEAEPKEGPEEQSVDDFSESSDPVRLYLKEMGKFQLLTREGEVEVAKRIEAGEREVEEEILKLPSCSTTSSESASRSTPRTPTSATPLRKTRKPTRIRRRVQ